jgi:diphthine-ammonia ligase
MCGIVGFVNYDKAVEKVLIALKIMKNRGPDGFGVFDFNSLVLNEKLSDFEGCCNENSKNAIGHNLLSIVNKVAQPIQINETVLSANCEIYNWEELAKEFSITAENDADLILKLVTKIGIKKAIARFDGPFAFCYIDKKKGVLYLVRDILGIKPLWVCVSKNGKKSQFGFASEKKAMENLVLENVFELNPKKYLELDLNTYQINYHDRDFFEVEKAKELGLTKTEIIDELEKKVIMAVKKRIPNKKIGVLFSGGVDSTVLCLILKKMGVEFTCYTAAMEDDRYRDSQDLFYARKISKELGFNLKVKTLKLEEVQEYIKEIVPLIEDTNVIKVGVALPFFLATKEAEKDNVRVMLSGLGSEEIFAGYQRHQNAININKECLEGLKRMHERDLYRDDVITMNHKMELRLPLLDHDLIRFALKIPSKYKISQGEVKVIFRELALKLGLAKEYAYRKKTAAQYGSNFDKAIQKLSKKEKKSKSEYLLQFSKKTNLNLAVLFSSGKDSMYAAYLMKKQNYNLSCLITINSENESSYMYHTPNIWITKLQAEAMQLPILIKNTKGEKEKELEELKSVLIEAKVQYNIDGVITGALYSTYQRDRVAKICDELGLKIFNPLWHIDQETEIRDLIKHDFKVIISSVAGYGFNQNYLGREIDTECLNDLVKLNKKIGINIAGEGGEFESTVLDCPLFKKRILVNKATSNMVDENTGFYVIEDAKLVDKD